MISHTSSNYKFQYIDQQDKITVQTFLNVINCAINKQDYLNKVQQFDIKFTNNYQMQINCNQYDNKNYQQIQKPLTNYKDNKKIKNPFLNSKDQEFYKIQQQQLQYQQQNQSTSLNRTNLFMPPKAPQGQITNKPTRIVSSQSQQQFYRENSRHMDDLQHKPNFQRSNINNNMYQDNAIIQPNRDMSQLQQHFAKNYFQKSQHQSHNFQDRSYNSPYMIHPQEGEQQLQMNQPQYVKYYKKLIPSKPLQLQNPTSHIYMDSRTNPFSKN